MGNGVGKLKLCFAGDAGEISGRRHDITVYISDHLDEGFGHSFCYFGPDPNDSASAAQTTTTTSFKTISGASLSANTCTQLSTLMISKASLDKASSFQSSDSFTAIPLQPIPRYSIPSVRSGPIPRTAGSMSGPVERWFLSGPIERSLISGPLENQYDHIQRYKPSSKKWSLIKRLKLMIANSITLPAGQPKGWDWATGLEKNSENVTVSSQTSLADESDESFESSSVQWAQGKAGEDRVHIVVSEEDGWVFVGIYDGFNGPDATDFLLSNLYSNVREELKGLLWNDAPETAKNSAAMEMDKVAQDDEFDQSVVADHVFDNGSQWLGQENHPCRKKRRKSMNSHWRWKREWERERSELDRILKEKSGYSGCTNRHSDVLKALSEALRKTEESYLEIADLMLMENPVLSLMGSCVLVMLMKGEDVYLMNVGDSRAVLAQKPEPDIGIGKAGRPDLERIKEETTNDLEAFDGDEFSPLTTLDALQLTVDHSTSTEEEVRRIKKEHQDDATAIANDRVKGSLKVTRAFGAGFLKKPKWNNALLEMFRIDYVGNSPYINCIPTLHHHRLGPRDRFLILSSDGLYQYFTDEEAVSEVETFLSSCPEGDPAQHLVELVLSRAANKAGMDFHELLDIPQGDRRRYHDDVSIIIISFEGRMWRSSL